MGMYYSNDKYQTRNPKEAPMFTEASLLKKIGLAILALFAAIGSKFCLNMKDNNPIEQIAEDVIKNEINIDVDFSEKPAGSKSPLLSELL